MGTHPIFESDFDCLTEWMTRNWKFLLSVRRFWYSALSFILIFLLIKVFLVWKHAKAKGSPEQIELSISIGVILFCWLLNGMYATAAALETQYFWEIYHKSRSSEALLYLIFHYVILLFYLINFIYSLLAISDHRSFSQLEFLRFRLVSCAYFQVTAEVLHFILYSQPTIRHDFSKIFFIALLLDIIFQCISIDKTKDFEVNYDTIPVNEKLRARDELINLYSSQTILIYLIFSVFHILLLCCGIFYILINTMVFYVAGGLFWYLCCVRPFASHLLIMLTEHKASKPILYLTLIVFVLLISPCLILCLILRTIHLGMFSIIYFTMRPLSSVDDNLKRDEKLNTLISSLKCKGKGSAIQNFIEHRIRPFGIDI